MAKAFVVIQNLTRVISRHDSKQEAEDAAELARAENPRASFEFGKMDKRLYTSIGGVSYTPVDEAL